MKKFKVLALSVLLLICSVLIFVPTTANAELGAGYVPGLSLGGFCHCPAHSVYNCLCWKEVE